MSFGRLREYRGTAVAITFLLIATMFLWRISNAASVGRTERLLFENSYSGEVWEYEVTANGEIVSEALIKPPRSAQPFVWAGARILVGSEIFRLLTIDSEV